MFQKDDVNKWKKYEILCFLGFADIEYLREAIKRFKRTEVDNLLSYIDNFFETNLHYDKMLVVKFVTKYDVGQLYNLRIYERQDRGEIHKLISENTNDKIIEYWVCPSTVSKTPNNFSGRYLFDSKNLDEEVIELIWWTSPRLLESHVESEMYPYARYIKQYTNLCYRNDRMIVPKNSNIGRLEIQECIKKVIILLQYHQNSTDWFKKILDSCRIKVFSLEFKFENGIGTFIDWDTPNDKKVIQRIEEMK